MVPERAPAHRNTRIFYMQVTRQEYENCHIYSNQRRAHMVINCSNPLRRKRFTILFEEFQAIPNVAEFVAGSTYYYISEYLTGDTLTEALADYQAK